MQLYTVHKIMILAGIGMCVVFGLRELLIVDAGERSLAIVAGSLAVAVALGAYLRKFLGKIATEAQP